MKMLDEMEKTIRKDPQAKSDILEKMEKQKALCELIERIKESGLLHLQDSSMQHINCVFTFLYENQRRVLQDCAEKLSSMEEKLKV